MCKKTEYVRGVVRQVVTADLGGIVGAGRVQLGVDVEVHSKVSRADLDNGVRRGNETMLLRCVVCYIFVYRVDFSRDRPFVVERLIGTVFLGARVMVVVCVVRASGVGPFGEVGRLLYGVQTSRSHDTDSRRDNVVRVGYILRFSSSASLY